MYLLELLSLTIIQQINCMVYKSPENCEKCKSHFLRVTSLNCSFFPSTEAKPKDCQSTTIYDGKTVNFDTLLIRIFFFFFFLGIFA